MLARCDLASLHRALGGGGGGGDAVAGRECELRAALRCVFATHAIFCLYAFPMPPRSPTADGARALMGGAVPPARTGGADERPTGGPCAQVAATWPLVESEVQATLRELARLHSGAGDGARAAAYKGMYRLALTQRELLGTDVLLHLAEEEARTNSSST